MKKINNDNNEIPRWLSEHNHLNLDGTTYEIERLGPVRFIWDGDNYGENFIQVAKDEFASQRGSVCR